MAGGDFDLRFREVVSELDIVGCVSTEGVEIVTGSIKDELWVTVLGTRVGAVWGGEGDGSFWEGF